MEDDYPPATVFFWDIKNFSKLTAKKLYSETFTVSGNKWHILVFPKGNDVDDLSLYLDVANSATLSPGWSVELTFSFVLFDRCNSGRTKRKGTQHLFTKNGGPCGFASFIALRHLHSKYCGYLEDDTLCLQVEIQAGSTKSLFQPKKRFKFLRTVSNVVPLFAMELQEPKALDGRKDVQNIAHPDPTSVTEVVQVEGNDGLRRTKVVRLPAPPDTEGETTNVNGFRVSVSKADIVQRIFEKHPDFVSNFHLKNHQLRSAFMNSMLALIEKFCQSPVDFSEDDLSYSRTTLMDLENVGFQVDWLNTKLEEVVRRKHQTGELVKKLEEMKQAMHGLEAEIQSTRASLSINEIL